MKVYRTPAIKLVRPEATIFLNNPIFRALCEAIGEVWATDDKMPGGHFCTYFGVIESRKDRYSDNPNLHALYLLHELWHWRMFQGGSSDLRYNNKRTWDQWQRAMFDCEFEASLKSECMAHFEIPGLRPLVFNHPIWVDAFHPPHTADDSRLTEKFMVDTQKKLRHERMRVLSGIVDPRNYAELQIRGYTMSNMAWAQIWAGKTELLGEKCANMPAWRVVEQHMEQPDWSDRHEKWLASVSGKYDGALIPFPEQAKQFTPVYEDNLKRFSNEVYHT